MKPWIAALACAGFIAGAGPESTEVPISLEIVNTPDSPVLIKSASVELRPQASPGGSRITPVVTMQALSNMRERAPVDSFTVRIDILQPDGRARGFHSYALGSEGWGADGARFAVALEDWFLAADDQLQIAVIAVRVGNRTWSEGVWTEDVDMELPPGPHCGRDFCVNMAAACIQVCKKAGCILSFTCKIGPKSCETDCRCRNNMICGGTGT